MFLFSVKMQKTKIMKKSKRIELTENTIKSLAKKAIDEGTSNKPLKLRKHETNNS